MPIPPLDKSGSRPAGERSNDGQAPTPRGATEATRVLPGRRHSQSVNLDFSARVGRERKSRDQNRAEKTLLPGSNGTHGIPPVADIGPVAVFRPGRTAKGAHAMPLLYGVNLRIPAPRLIRRPKQTSRAWTSHTGGPRVIGSPHFPVTPGNPWAAWSARPPLTTL